MQEAHSREARLGDLRRTDGVIGAGRLAAALRIQPRVALAEMHEASLHSVGDTEVKMAPVRFLEEACGAQVLVIAFPVDIGPEFARGLRHTGFAWQIFAALDQRRSEAEVEAEQGRLACRFPVRFRDGDSLVAFPLRARPVDRDRPSEAPHLRLRGRAFGFAATKSRERPMTSRTRSSS